MKRTITVNYAENQAEGLAPGDGAAHRAAAALADRSDMPTLDAFAAVLSFLEHIGGQAYITALRVQNENGDFDTAGLIINYETRDARIEFFKKPDEVGGVPVTDSSGPGTKIEVDAAPELDLTTPYATPDSEAAEAAVEELPDDGKNAEAEPEAALVD